MSLTEDAAEASLFAAFGGGGGGGNAADDASSRSSSESLARKLRFSEIPVNPAELPNATHDRADRLKVFVRARPLAGGEVAADMMLSDAAVAIRTKKANTQGRESVEETTFSFDTVFNGDSTQAEVYEQTMLPQVKSLFKGRDTLTFAYGITNAGKTYTVQGKDDGDEKGLLPRALETIFGALEQQQQRQRQRQPQQQTAVGNNEGGSGDGSSSNSDGGDEGIGRDSEGSTSAGGLLPPLDPSSTYELRASFLEVYGNDAFDLLAPAEPKGPFGMGGYKRPALKLKEDRGQVFVDGLKEVDLPDLESAQKALQLGWANRASASNGLNMDSSRSHAVLCVKLLATSSKADGGVATSATRLCVVDLAGAERQKKTNASGHRLNEAMSINKDLMVLGHCLRDLRYNQLHAKGTQKVPPFRESRITMLFRDYLSGNGQISVVAALSPRLDDAHGSLDTLRFAAVAQQVKIVEQKPPPAQKVSANLVPRCATGQSAVHGGGGGALVKIAGGGGGGGASKSVFAGGVSSVAESRASLESVLDAGAPEMEHENQTLRLQVIALQERLVNVEAERLTMERTIREEVAVEMKEAMESTEAEMARRLEEERYNMEQLFHKRLELIKGQTGKRAEEASVLAHTEILQQTRDIQRKEAEHQSQLKRAEAELDAKRAELEAALAELLVLRVTASNAEALQQRADAAEAKASALSNELAESEMAKGQLQGQVESVEFRLGAEREAKAALQASVNELNERLANVVELTRHSRRKSTTKASTSSSKKQSTAGNGGGDGATHAAAGGAEHEGGAMGEGSAVAPSRPSLGDVTGSLANAAAEHGGDAAADASSARKSGRRGRRSLLSSASKEPSSTSAAAADSEAMLHSDGKPSKPSMLKRVGRALGGKKNHAANSADANAMMPGLDDGAGFFDLGAPPTIAPPPLPEPTPIARRTRAGRAAA